MGTLYGNNYYIIAIAMLSEHQNIWHYIVYYESLMYNDKVYHMYIYSIAYMLPGECLARNEPVAIASTNLNKNECYSPLLITKCPRLSTPTPTPNVYIYTRIYTSIYSTSICVCIYIS